MHCVIYMYTLCLHVPFLIHLNDEWFRFLSHCLLHQVTHELTILHNFTVWIEYIWYCKCRFCYSGLDMCYLPLENCTLYLSSRPSRTIVRKNAFNFGLVYTHLLIEWNSLMQEHYVSTWFNTDTYLYDFKKLEINNDIIGCAFTSTCSNGAYTQLLYIPLTFITLLSMISCLTTGILTNMQTSCLQFYI